MITDDLRARIIDCVQGGEEWHAARMGKVTGSRVAAATSDGRSKGAVSATREALMAEIICERRTGKRKDGFKSAAMERGTELEPEARVNYEFQCDVEVVTVGLVMHPTILLAGASPDGLVGTDGLVQFKCPEAHTHLATLEGKPIGGAYIKQMQWEMACTGRHWCDFVSYCPDWVGCDTHIIRVKRDPSVIVELERGVRAFLDEAAARQAAIEAKFGKVAA